LDNLVQLALLRDNQQAEERSSSPPPAADSSSIGRSSHQIEEQSWSPPAADSSPPRQIAALTPPRVLTAPSELFDNNKPAEIFISPHIPKIRKRDPIANGMLDKPPVDNVDFTHMIPGGLTRLLKRQGEQNNRAMYNLLGQAGIKVRHTAGGTAEQTSVRSGKLTEATPPTRARCGPHGPTFHVSQLE
jgi:hypothetical protein